ncbi:anti-sigma E factor [Vibrio sp. S17_S38]|uniref:RseA family anti-sigma factor n=1 Tax=Vibrio sp. S17_S38 TaxID=2720229 RepID=UPI001680AEDA|nr:RseA family anti-sigma factor [Vibrio sp. S17_S38]MBD1572402.1 anti-sigma E factor [Vibrio sp. S17_S38]
MTSKQQISALMDGELVDQSLITDIENDIEAQQSWSCYHLIGDTLRGDVAQNTSGWDIASQVAMVLESEPAHSKQNGKLAQVVPLMESQPNPQKARSKMPAWLSNLTQIGIAACVSLVVVLGVQQYSGGNGAVGESDQLPVLQTIPFSGSAEPVSLTSESVRTQSTEAKEMEQHRRINALMQDYELQLRLNHSSE